MKKYGSMKGDKSFSMPKGVAKSKANGKDSGSAPMKYSKDVNIVQSRAKRFA